MTYNLCVKLISTKKESLGIEEWNGFSSSMENKLDVFLLADRITEDQYKELIGILNS